MALPCIYITMRDLFKTQKRHPFNHKAQQTPSTSPLSTMQG